MALTRAQLLAGNQNLGAVLPGQVQAVSQGLGVLIDTDGTISVDASTAEGLVRLNNNGAYNGYIWPNTIGQPDQFLQLIDSSGQLRWADPNGFAVVTVSPLQPSPADEGELWYDCNTGYLKLFQNCVSPGGWTNVAQPGKEVLPGSTSAVPPFTNQGTPNAGTLANPYDCTITTTTPGTSIFIVNKVTVTGLAPNQFVPIVDLNAVANGGRFHFSNNYANGAGVLEFETIFIDLPQSPSGISYTAAIRVGYASVYIDAIVNVVAPLSSTPGSISGAPVVGNQLTYTQGVASGGIGAYTYTWDWKDSGGNTLASNVTTYVPTGAEVGDTIYVELTVTDSAPSPTSVTVTTSNTAPVTALTLVSAGSISGSATTGSTLTYTPGSATGGAPPTNYAWQWKNDLGSILLSGSGTAPQTYVVPVTQVGRTISVTFTATDSATTPNIVSGITASTATIAGTPITNAQFPTTIPGTASFTWNNGNGITLTATDCIEFDVNNSGTFVTSATVNTNDIITTQWIVSPACGGAPQGTTINGTLTSSNNLVSTASLTINRLPTSVTLNPTSATANVNSVITAVNFSTTGANTAPLLWGILSAGTTPEYSLNGGTTWIPLPSTPTAANTIPPGVTALVRYTTGGTPATETLQLRAGYSNTVGQYQSATLTTTVSFAPFPNGVWNPTGTLGVVPGLISGTYNGTGTPIVATGCLEVSTDGTNFSQSEPITSGQTLYARWITSPGCGAAPSGTQLNGTVSDGNYLNSYGPVTIDRKPDPFGFNPGSTTAPLSSLQTSNSVSITGINTRAYITLGSLSAGATGLEARVNGGTWTPVPSAPSTALTIDDTNTLEVRFVTGPTASGTYTAVVNIGDGDNVQFTASSPGFVVQNTASTAFPGVTFNPAGGPNAAPETTLNVNGGTLGTLEGTANSNSWPAGLGTTLSSPASGGNPTLKFRVNGAGGFVTSGLAVSPGNTLNLAWNQAYLDTVLTGNIATGTFTGTVGATTYTNTVTMTVERAASFTTTSGPASGAGGTITLVSQTPNEYNVPLKVYQTPGTPALTSVMVDIGGNGPVSLPTTVGSALTINPGQTISFTAVAPGAPATYSTDIHIGDTVNTWQYEVTVIPTVSTPSIDNPTSGSTVDPGLNSPAGITVTTPTTGLPGGFVTNYGGTQTDADWYIYKGIPFNPETSAITGVGVTNYASGTSFSGTYQAGNVNQIFDGVLTQSDALTGRCNGFTISFTNLPPATTSLRVWVGAQSGSTSVTTSSGTAGIVSPVPPGGNWVSVPLTGTMTQISWSGGGVGDSCFLSGIEVDGVLLVDGVTTLTLTDSQDLASMVIGDLVKQNNSVGVSYSASLVSSTGTVSNPANAFDGTTSTYSAASPAPPYGTTLTFNASSYGLSGTLRVMPYPVGFAFPGSGTISVNGGAPVSWSGAGTFINLGSFASINSIAVTGNAANTAGAISAIEVNGVILTNGANPIQGNIVAINSGSAPYTLTLNNVVGTWSTTQTAIDTSRTVFPPVPSVLPPAVPDATKYTPITGFNPLNITSGTFNEAFIPQADLTQSTKYYASVIYTGSGGTPVVSTASAWSTFNTSATFTPPAIGAPLGGGYYAGQIRVPGGTGTIYNLIVAPRRGTTLGPNPAGTLLGEYSTNGGLSPGTIAYSTLAGASGNPSEAQDLTYGGTWTTTAGGTTTTGLGGIYPLFGWCKNDSNGPNGGGGIGGFTDWYIPAKNELEVLYYYLKPNSTGTQPNTTSSGSNPNAVAPEPVSTNYTSTSPAQTTASLFQGTNAQALSPANFYWSSTEYSSGTSNAWGQLFNDGSQSFNGKNSNLYARAVRRVAA